MANRNITSPTAEKIFREWEKIGRCEAARTYLGASVIGHECEMYLWLHFRMAFREGFDGRMYRLFNRGQREEAVFCGDLRRIGCEVKEIDENTGTQFSVSDLGGHFGGHLDALVRGLDEAPKQWFVAEFKTHSNSSFSKLVKEGVEKSKPMHYAQMQVYMGETGLKKAVYMAVNKDNDDLWVETVDFNEAAFGMIIDRARHIIGTCTPIRCASRPDDFRCKACQARSVCWHEAKQFVDPSVPTSCRTCCHATADTESDGAKWTCRLGHSCSSCGSCGVQCDDHLIIPSFVSAEIEDGSPNSITYSSSGKRFTSGKGGFSTDDLKRFGPAELDGVLTVKDAMPGSKVESSNSVEANYSGDQFRTAFFGASEKVHQWCEEHSFHAWDNPTSRSECNGIMYFEYLEGTDRTLVRIDRNNGTGSVVTNIPPF